MLTIGTGPMLFFWAEDEIFVGILISIFIGIIAKDLAFWNEFYNFVKSPIRWFLFLIYILGPFFFAMAKANLDVAYRVITGKINPGIVKISTGLRTDLGTTMLANSITLTPGTLTVDVDENNNLYIHWINVKNKEPKPEEVCGNLLSWVKKIIE